MVPVSLVAILCLALPLQVAWAGHLLLRWLWSLPVSACDLRSLGRVAAALLRPILLSSPDDPWEQRVARMEVARRRRTFAMLLPFAVFCNTTYLVWDFAVHRRWVLAVHVLFGTPTDGETASVELGLWISSHVRQLLPVIYLVVPQSLTPNGMRFAIGVVFARLLLEVWSVDDFNYPFWMCMTTPLRIGSCILLAEVGTSTLFNVALSVASCLLHDSVPWHLNFGMQVVVCITTFALCCLMAFTRDAQHRATLEAKALRSVELAADGLLSKLCDAVVHLGEDLRIRRPCPQLAALLLRSGDTGMEGVPFANLSAGAEEAERLLGFLCRHDEGADCLTVSLKDSNATAVNVRIYHVMGRDADDAIFHVVGVCEEIESSRLPPEASPADGTLGGLYAWSAARCPSTSSRDSVTDTENSVETLQQEGGITVCFWPLKEGYPIKECSVGFTTLSGPSACGTKLLTWFQGGLDEFVAKVQKVVMTWHMSRSDITGQLHAAKLAPPHMQRIGMRLQADILLTMDHNSGSEDTSSWTVKAALSQVKQLKRRSSSSARSLASGLNHAGARRSAPADAAAGRGSDPGRRSGGSGGSRDSREGRPTLRRPPADPAGREA